MGLYFVSASKLIWVGRNVCNFGNDLTNAQAHCLFNNVEEEFSSHPSHSQPLAPPIQAGFTFDNTLTHRSNLVARIQAGILEETIPGIHNFVVNPGKSVIVQGLIPYI
jgi:hypothetical protein